MRKRLAILLALLLSLLVHLSVLVGDLIPPATLELPDDARLKPVDVQLKEMSLDAHSAAAAPQRTTVTLVPATTPNAVPVTPPKPKPKPPRRAPPKPHPAKPAAGPWAAASAGSAESLAEASAPAAEKLASQPVASAPHVERAPHQAEALAPAKLSKAQASAAVEEAQAIAEGKDWPGQGVGPDGMLRASQPLTRFPSSAKLSYQVFYGKLLAGQGQIVWQRDGNRYSLVAKLGGFGQRLRYESLGSLDAHGLKPDSFKAFRNDQPREHAEFDWAAGVLRYGDGKEEKLETGAQDVLSLGWQLALKGARLGLTQITTGKKVYSYPLKPAGETVFDTGAGKMRAVVIRARGDDDITEFWLAPGYANLPIRITRIDPDKKLEQRIVAIDINEQEEWRLPAAPSHGSGK